MFLSPLDAEICFCYGIWYISIRRCYIQNLFTQGKTPQPDVLASIPMAQVSKICFQGAFFTTKRACCTLSKILQLGNEIVVQIVLKKRKIYCALNT